RRVQDPAGVWVEKPAVDHDWRSAKVRAGTQIWKPIGERRVDGGTPPRDLHVLHVGGANLIQRRVLTDGGVPRIVPPAALCRLLLCGNLASRDANQPNRKGKPRYTKRSADGNGRDHRAPPKLNL